MSKQGDILNRVRKLSRIVACQEDGLEFPSTCPVWEAFDLGKEFARLNAASSASEDEAPAEANGENRSPR